MSNYKLTYFNVRGRAEVPRLIFAKAGVEYEDYRINKATWQSFKDCTPFGKLPVLEVDGKMYAQSMAISRFLGRRFGLYGADEIEEIQIDMICLAMEDFLKILESYYHEYDPDRKEDIRNKYEREYLPTLKKSCKKLLQRNHDGDEYFVGNNMTIADIYFAHYMTVPEDCGLAVDWTDCPQLKKLKERVESDAGIAEWIERRPKTDH